MTRSHTPNLLLAYTVILQCVLFIAGIGLNLVLVLMTIKGKNLRSMFNYLFAFFGVFQILNFTGIPVFLVSTVVDLGQDLCFHLSIPEALGSFTTTLIPLILAIDRVIATCKPNQYKALKHSEIWYISFLMFFPIFYGFWIVFLAFLQQGEDIDNSYSKPSSFLCLLPEAFGTTYLFYAMTTLSFMLITFPLLIFVHFRMKTMEYDSAIFYLFRALTISIVLFYGSILISHGILLITNNYPPKSSETLKHIKVIGSTLKFLLQTLIVPVFCFYVTDYRTAFQELFGVKPMKTVGPSMASRSITASVIIPMRTPIANRYQST